MKELLYLAATRIDPDAVGVPTVEADANAIGSLLNVAYFWAGVVAVIVIVIAGYFFTLSRGDASQIARAKNAIIAAVAGLIVILMAFTITQFILGNVG